MKEAHKLLSDDHIKEIAELKLLAWHGPGIQHPVRQGSGKSESELRNQDH